MRRAPEDDHPARRACAPCIAPLHLADNDAAPRCERRPVLRSSSRMWRPSARSATRRARRRVSSSELSEGGVMLPELGVDRRVRRR